jgi:TetR/AcrR family transcriptional regulator, cholesterol catabolism regulator
MSHTRPKAEPNRPLAEVASGDAIASKGERTRRRILDSAATTFARKGIASISMGDVAEAAGMKTGSLYFHFRSKDELINEVLREGIGQALAHLQRAMAAQRSAGASAAALLRTAIEAHVVARHDLSDYATIVARSAADRSQRAGDPYLPQERRYGRYWIDLLREAQAAGVIPADHDVRLLRDLLFGAMNAPATGSRGPKEITRALYAIVGITDDQPCQRDPIDIPNAGFSTT